MRKSIRVAVAVALLGIGGAAMFADGLDWSPNFWVGAVIALVAAIWLAWEYYTMAESKDGEKPPLFKVGKAKTILYEDHEHLGDRAHSDIGEVDDLTAKRIRSTPAGKKD